MTTLLERAFSEAAKLPDQEQDVIGARLLAELSNESEFDHAIATSADQLVRLAQEALAEDRAGLTQKLNPERL